MINKFITAFFSLFILSCSDPQPDNEYGNEQFSKELRELKDYFQIPGMAVLVKKGDQTLYEDHLGFADLKKDLRMDSTITIPMASLTKIFTSTLIWMLVEEGKVSLEDMVSDYARGYQIPDSIRIEHVLSHTSQGNLGKNFYYNNSRFMLLGQIIETASGKSFKSNVYEKIISPLGLKNTYLLEDTIQVASENRKIASPYFLDGKTTDGIKGKKITEGFIDYGYSAVAGIASTVHDIAKLGASIADNRLLAKSSVDKMFSPYQTGLPYGLGIFTQELMGEKLVWGYGQYDCYSSLLLLVPDQELVFVIAANNDLLSNPARLIAGDITYSLFALSFLKNFVFDVGQMPLFENSMSIREVGKRIDRTNGGFYLKKLLAQSVTATFMAQFDTQEIEVSREILQQVFDLYPNYNNYGDLVLMHHLNMLKSMNTKRDKKEFVEFDRPFTGIGDSLLRVDPFNPYANYYMANYYQIKGISDSTSYYFSQVVNAQNFTSWWYTKEAERWIKENEKEATGK
ncbi:MAG: serine hydrolase domain-containing protein [Bacteroidota bacterium]